MLDRSRGYGPRKWWVDRPRPGQHCRYVPNADTVVAFMSREARIIVGLLLSVLAATFWLAAHDRNVIIYVIVAALVLTAAVCVITSVRASDQRNVGLEALATIVGDPDAFIATVASHVARFHSWGADKKGFPPENEDLYREWLWRHADQLSRNENRELLVAAIAEQTIGIGARIAPGPLPHHLACGSALGDSALCSKLRPDP
jgi:hypothetical protein